MGQFSLTTGNPTEKASRNDIGKASVNDEQR